MARGLQNILKTLLTWSLSRDLQNALGRSFQDIFDLVIDWVLTKRFKDVFDLITG